MAAAIKSDYPRRAIGQMQIRSKNCALRRFTQASPVMRTCTCYQTKSSSQITTLQRLKMRTWRIILTWLETKTTSMVTMRVKMTRLSYTKWMCSNGRNRLLISSTRLMIQLRKTRTTQCTQASKMLLKPWIRSSERIRHSTSLLWSLSVKQNRWVHWTIRQCLLYHRSNFGQRCLESRL